MREAGVRFGFIVAYANQSQAWKLISSDCPKRVIQLRHFDRDSCVALEIPPSVAF